MSSSRLALLFVAFFFALLLRVAADKPCNSSKLNRNRSSHNNTNNLHPLDPADADRLRFRQQFWLLSRYEQQLQLNMELGRAGTLDSFARVLGRAEEVLFVAGMFRFFSE